MADRLKATATFHAVEDPELVAFLEEVEGDDRAARVRRLMRRGFESLRTGVISIAAPLPTMPGGAGVSPAAEVPAVVSGLDALGLNPAEFEWGARSPS